MIEYNTKWIDIPKNFIIQPGMLLLLKNNKNPEKFITELTGARYKLPKNYTLVGYNALISGDIDFKSYAFKESYLKPERTENNSISVSTYLKVDLMIAGEEKIIYQRRRDTSLFDLDQMALYLFNFDRKYNNSSTYAEEVLQSLEKKGFKSKSGKTTMELLQLYWVDSNYHKLINEEYEEFNKGNFEFLWEVENDYLKYCISSMSEAFVNSPMPVKVGFLYWFWKYIFNESLEELMKDYNQVPDFLKNWVDESVEKKS